jgi:hypothetical protein
MNLLSSIKLLGEAWSLCAQGDFLNSYIRAESASIAAGLALAAGRPVDEVKTMQVRIACFIVDTWAPRALEASKRSSPRERAEQLRAIALPLTQAASYLEDQAKDGRLVNAEGAPVSVEEITSDMRKLVKPIEDALAAEEP